MLLGFIVGLVAEWLRRGLQILAPRFDSGRGLQENQRLAESKLGSKTNVGDWSVDTTSFARLACQCRRRHPSFPRFVPPQLAEFWLLLFMTVNRS